MRRVTVFYKPYLPYWLTDILLLAFSFFVVLMWFPLSTDIPFQKYWIFALVFSGVWMLSSYFTHRYVRIKFMRIGTNLLRLMAASAITFGVMNGYMLILAEEHNYSIWVLLTIWLTMLISSVLFLIIFHAYHYALNIEPDVVHLKQRGAQPPLQEEHIYDKQQQKNIKESVSEYSSNEVAQYLESRISLYSSNTYILRTSELFNIQKLKNYRFSTIINLMPLNQIRGINKMFGTVNNKLPDNGLYICCFKPQEVEKTQILSRHHFPLNWIQYINIFLYKRVLPKLFMTSRLYYDITEGKNRVLSKSEVLGRLCYCGFEIKDVQQMDDIIYVIAERSFQPETVQRRLYGMFVSLSRIGKNGKIIKVYKFRTMHPYSEYLQAYIYEQNSLQEGGKFKDDFRITTLGKFMRKTWIDELPMLINVLKGDLKLVGVRPISAQYMSLYSKELQHQRIKHRPGLLPPFYADMPKTIEEIEASEKKYLDRCETRGTFSTDFIYFWKILYNIILKRARSK